MTSYDLQQVRSELPVLQQWTYLNTGTVGIMPDPVFDDLCTTLRLYEQGGHTTQADVVKGADNAKASLANLLNVAQDDIALTRNATDGINLIASTFPLESGDEVITTTEEHPAMVLPLLNACERAGARLIFMPFAFESDELEAQLGSVASDRTRLIAVSQVSCETGARMPVSEIRRALGDEIAILVDASQSVGQFPVSIPEISADFVIGNGHKWLAGPKGTGFAWISRKSADLIPPVNVASDAFDPRWSRSHYQAEPAPALKFAEGADRYEFGTRSWHLHAGLTSAINYQNRLDFEEITEHIARQSTTVKRELSMIPKVTVHSPLAWNQSSGLVTFSISGLAGESVASTLWNDYQIAQRRVEKPSAVRISTAYFTDDEDLSNVIAAVRTIAATA